MSCCVLLCVAVCCCVLLLLLLLLLLLAQSYTQCLVTNAKHADLAQSTN